MTSKQRAKVYLKAAKYFSSKRKAGGKSGFCDLGYRVEDYPEYSMFNPKNDRMYWFPTVDFSPGESKPDQGERVTALLFCELMAKDNICV